MPSPRHDAEIIAAPCPRLQSERAAVRTEIDLESYEPLITRRAGREPLQHLTGRAYFRHLELSVGPGVFLPRPETEVLAGWVIDRLRDGSASHPVVVDLCTGSGAVALAVATEVPGAQVHAVELDEAAHAWAMRNLADSGVRLVQGDLVDAFGELDGTVDVVVANPPYIPFDAWESVDPEVRDHDPAAALWAEGDGLSVIRQVERTAARLLRAGRRGGRRARRCPGRDRTCGVQRRPGPGTRFAIIPTWPGGPGSSPPPGRRTRSGARGSTVLVPYGDRRVRAVRRAAARQSGRSACRSRSRASRAGS